MRSRFTRSYLQRSLSLDVAFKWVHHRIWQVGGRAKLEQYGLEIATGGEKPQAFVERKMLCAADVGLYICALTMKLEDGGRHRDDMGYFGACHDGHHVSPKRREEGGVTIRCVPAFASCVVM